MSKGVNSVTISGNVGSVNFDTTYERGDDVCSFTLAVEKARNMTTWVRINVYGGAVEACKNYLVKGKYVIVEGELMNRMHKQRNDTVLEVRCRDIKFPVLDGGMYGKEV